MSESDIWQELQELLIEKPPNDNGAPSIIEYSKAIPMVSFEASSFGESQPIIKLGHSSESFIPSYAYLKSKSPLNYASVCDQLIEELDSIDQNEMIQDIQPFQCRKRTFLRDINSQENQMDLQCLLPIQENELIEHPPIETTLYINHDIFTGEIESINVTYLSNDLKSFSTQHDPKSLTKEIKLHKVILGDRVYQDEDLSGEYFKDRDIRQNRQLSMNKDEGFEQKWTKLFGASQVEEEIQQQKSVEIELLPSLQDQPENNIISESDINFLNHIAEIQKIAQSTARKNDVEQNQEEEEEENDEQQDDDQQDETTDEQQYEEEEFLESISYAPKADVLIQEQDPEIRKKIEEALKVKTKFKIIKFSDYSKESNFNTHQNMKWAVEDESDMSNFYEYLPKSKMAKQYPFELDDFQKRSILHLEKKESVFVCAHTSAGKTVIAEYAIAMAFKHNRRAIYTSPIKALSNQKYREFELTFGNGNAGVITGDVTINPAAPCLILTTEILRNMLYRGAELIRDVEWVVFDEVHYVNDQERGMVWEETIIMLPPHIGIIMLSATVPNFMDFANWVGRTKKNIIYVMKTYVRPVPLEHHLYIFDKFHMIKEKDGGFLSEEYNTLKKKIDNLANENLEKKERIAKNLEEKKEDDLYKNTSKNQRARYQEKQIKTRFIQNVSRDHMRFKEEKRTLIQLIKLCEKKQLLPCVIFVFSKKKISELAKAIIDQKGFKLIDNKTEGTIIHFFDRSLHRLKPQDRKAPQLLYVRELLRYGVAIHHGDLLPIAKEIVEILFSEGQIKVLLATETFAMGINMPTKTVIFHSLEKFDSGSNGMRMLHSSEYTQMSGRAGRRGLDEKGTVLIFVKDPTKLPPFMKMNQMLDHKGKQLESKFKITYRIILNLLTSKEMDASEMMKRSFLENYRYTSLPQNLQTLDRLRKDYVNYSMVSCPYQKGIRGGLRKAMIEDYVEVSKTFRMKQFQFVHDVLENSKQYVNFPRYIIFVDHGGNVCLGIAINVEYHDRKPLKRNYYILQPEDNSYNKFIVMTVHSSRESPRSAYRYRKIQLNYQTEVKYQPKQLRSKSDFYYTINEIGDEDILDFLENVPTQQKQSYNNTIDSSYDDFATQLLEKQQQFDSIQTMLDQIYSGQIAPKKKQAKEGLSKLKYKFTKNANQKIKQQPANEDNNEDESTFWKFRDEQIKEILNSQCHNCDLKKAHLDQLEKKQATRSQIEELKKKVDDISLESKEDFQYKLLVLKNLGYVDENDNPLIKARIARELQDANSIYVCELLVENIMDGLNPPEIASLLGAFVCQSRGFNKEEESGMDIYQQKLLEFQGELPMDLTHALSQTLDLVERLIEREVDLGAIDQSEEKKQLRASLDFSLTPAIFLWANGGSFVDICYESQIEEGFIVRTIQRLESLLRNVRNAYKVIGNQKMMDKIDKATLAIKKDIVFAESLYFNSDASKVKSIQNNSKQ